MNVKAGFPVNGLAEVTPYSDTETGTSADMLNVVPFDRDGRLRGANRYGLEKWSDQQISGSNRIQCLQTVSATYVEPVLGDGTMVNAGDSGAASPDFQFRAPADGTATDAASSDTYLGSVWGADDKCFVILHNSTTVKLERRDQATPATADYSVTIFTAGSAPAADHLYGLTVDEDTVYVWYEDIDNIGEGILRLDVADGLNRDSTTDGVWIRAEIDATHIELVFGGVSNAGWDTITSTSHSMMKAFAGKIACVSAPLEDGGGATDHELVLYIINSKTGIIDAVHDLGLDGNSGSANQGTFKDLEFGLDGFIYVLTMDNETAGSDDDHYLRKIDTSGNGIWELELGTTNAVESVCWNPDRSMLALCGSSVLGTGEPLVIIDPDSKGIVDYAGPGSPTTWDMVRCDKSGNYYLWDSSTPQITKASAAFAETWTKTDLVSTNQNRGSINTFWNPGHDEQGSTRYQHTIAVCNGTLKTVTTTTSATPTGGSSAFDSSQQVIYAANLGVFTFFADGTNAKYYDPVDDEVKGWQANMRYGTLPTGFNQIEIWNNQLLLFDIDDDPSNYYFLAQGDPFDMKLQTGVAGGAISGRLSSAGLFAKGTDKLVAAIPYNTDLLILGGDHSIWQMSLDPAVDAQQDLITDSVGIAPGRAWCRDSYYNIYFFGNDGGIYRLGLDAPPERISNRAIDDRFIDVDVANSTIYLVWNARDQGVIVTIRNNDGTTATTHYFYDFRTEGWFPWKFGELDHNPNAITIFDQDAPQDRKILYGGGDGYIRNLVATATDDDGTLFDRYFVLGPFVSQDSPHQSLLMTHLDVVVGNGVDMTVDVLSGPDAETVIRNGRKRYRKEITEQALNVTHPFVSGKSLAVRCRTRSNRDVEFEGMTATLEPIRSL